MRVVIGAALLCLSIQSNAQSALDTAERAADSDRSSPLYLLLPPSIRSGYVIRDFIRSNAFTSYDSTHTTDEVFDEIYYTATALAHGELDHAFAAASFGSLEHEYLPINLLGLRFDVPLTSESRLEFLTRQRNLPRHLYHTTEDDRDKLQHFFAGAWLKSWLGMDCLVALGGELVELFESTFVEGSARDPRDIHANNDGARFATKAARNISAPPSESLTKNP
jgi:hypothetical protein